MSDKPSIDEHLARIRARLDRVGPQGAYAAAADGAMPVDIR